MRCFIGSMAVDVNIVCHATIYSFSETKISAHGPFQHILPSKSRKRGYERWRTLGMKENDRYVGGFWVRSRVERVFPVRSFARGLLIFLQVHWLQKIDSLTLVILWQRVKISGDVKRAAMNAVSPIMFLPPLNPSFHRFISVNQSTISDPERAFVPKCNEHVCRH